MKNTLIIIFLLPIFSFFLLGSFSFVSLFDTIELSIPIYDYIFKSNLNNFDFFNGINSGEPYKAYGIYPWIQIFFFKNLSLSFSYQLVLLSFLAINFIGFFLLLNRELLIDKSISLIFSFLSSLFIIRTASIDFGHIACASLLIFFCCQFKNSIILRYKLLYVFLSSLLISGLLYIQYIPLLFLYSFIFNLIVFKSFKKNFIFHFQSFLLVILIRNNELYSIFYSISSSGREILPTSIDIINLVLENLLPNIDLYVFKIRTFINIFFLIIILIIFKKNKLNFDLIKVFLSIFLILFLNKYLIYIIPILSKFRIYPIIIFIQHIIFVMIAVNINIFNKSQKVKNLLIIISIIISALHSYLFISNHFINWLYNGNLENIDNNPFIKNLSNNYGHEFRVATYGYYPNFPLYYGLDSIGGYAPVSSSDTRNFWKNVNQNLLLKYPYLKEEFDKSFNNNSFVYLDDENISKHKFEDLFNVKLLADKNTKYIFSRIQLNSNLLELLYSPKVNLKKLKTFEKIINFIRFNYTYHDVFFIYEIKNYSDRVFLIDKKQKQINNINQRDLYSYKFINNEYYIDINNNSFEYLVLNHYYNKNWKCIDLVNKKELKLSKYEEYFIKVNLEKYFKIKCFYDSQ